MFPFGAVIMKWLPFKTFQSSLSSGDDMRTGSVGDQPRGSHKVISDVARAPTQYKAIVKGVAWYISCSLIMVNIPNKRQVPLSKISHIVRTEYIYDTYIPVLYFHHVQFSKLNVYVTELIHNSHNVLAKYPTMQHFVSELCTILLQNGAFWDIDLMHCGICELGLLHFCAQVTMPQGPVSI